ncbi:hypothetical protein [Streptomyces boncukensis]|uniref:Uncharacterized protein n=1 Tax=Streptomyces boncukensis TaxID=2711219 RepID=A0A6G4WUJ7_9ACTN|nr:hypothetical protein [Streptomyces boncukensis]NGO68214.1 hypothetical protein [Streptomyces boncukensis]
MIGGTHSLTLSATSVAPPARHGLWCECTLVQLDDEREWLLAGYRAPSPRLALRWLQHQSHHLSGLIDPRPDMLWAPVGLLHPLDDALDVERAPDPASALRRWRDDVAEHDQALQAMRDGSLYSFTAADSELRYRLSTRPILAAASPHHIPPITTRRYGSAA